MKYLLALVLLLTAHLLHAEELHGLITKVVDGNTVIFSSTDYEDQTIVLKGIDSPEPGQQFAEESRLMLEKLLMGKRVVVRIHGKDRLGNRLGEILVNNADPRKALVRAGLTWTSETDPELEAVREEAKALGKGIWGEADPTPPWIYRRQQSMLQLKSS